MRSGTDGPLRILMSCSEWPPMGGGVSALSREQGHLMSEAGWDVQVEAVGAAGASAHEQHGTLVLHRRDYRSGAVWRLAPMTWVLSGEARRFRPDFLWCSAYRGFGLPTLLAARSIRRPYGVYLHGTELRTESASRGRRAVMTAVLNGAAMLACNSQNTARLLPQLLPEVRRPVQTITPGCHAHQFATDEATAAGAELRRQILCDAGLSPDTQAVVFMAFCRMDRQKGIDIALRSMAQVRAARPEVPMVFVGVGEGPHRQDFVQLAAELGLASTAQFPGAAPYGSAPRYLAAADVYLQPSQPVGSFLESYGIAFLEAQAAGLSCIGTHWGGVPEATLPGETAWLVETGSAEAVAQAMLQVMEMPVEEMRRRRAAARHFAELHSWNAHGAELMAAIRATLDADTRS